MALSTAVDASAIARVVGIETNFLNLRRGNTFLLPMRVAVIGQGATASTYSTDKVTLTTAAEVGQRFGFGSPLHQAALQLLPANGDGVGSIPVTFYPLDDAGGATTAAGAVTPTGTATGIGSFRVRVGGVDSDAFTVVTGDNVAAVTAKIATAINAVLDMPVIATDNSTDVGLAAKWAGQSANDLVVEIVGTAATGITFGITQMSGGATNPDIQPALDQFGTVWETLVLNCLDIQDTTALDALQVFGESRWGALERKPFVAFSGNTADTVAAMIAISDARPNDRINAQLVAPGSNDYPMRVAARELARIAVIANNNPPVDYGAQLANGINPGPDADQFSFAERDQAVKAGSSTVEVRDGVIVLSDTVTFFHPSGDPTPAYRYVVDIIKLMNILFNLDLIFATADWNGAPLLPNNQPTANRAARKPKDAVAAVSAMLDSLGSDAIISDPAAAKAATAAEIDSQNPKRLNVTTTVQLSGNTNVISVDLNFGFFFGAQATAL